MGQTRKIWQDAKAKVKVKGFEATLHLKDDFGPDLDLLDSLSQDMFNHLNALVEKYAKIEQVARRIKATKVNYLAKVHGSSLARADQDVLNDGIKRSVKLAQDALENIKLHRLDPMEKSSSAALRVLD